jgi:hypothetical protein
MEISSSPVNNSTSSPLIDTSIRPVIISSRQPTISGVWPAAASREARSTSSRPRISASQRT